MIFVTPSFLDAPMCLGSEIEQNELCFSGGFRARCGDVFPHQFFLVLVSLNYFLHLPRKKLRVKYWISKKYTCSTFLQRIYLSYFTNIISFYKNLFFSQNAFHNTMSCIKLTLFIGNNISDIDLT